MKNLFYKYSIIIILLLINFKVFSKDFIIQGNEFTDDEIIISIIDKLPESDEKTKSNYILKKLINSGLFKSVEVSYDVNNFYINILEFPSIIKFYYENNERLKNEEIDNIINELEVYTLSDSKINNLIEELVKIYQSFGYNNIQINYDIELFSNNSANVFLEFNEGEITKIKKISFIGNLSFDGSLLLSKIKSKTKKITNLFANNNFKLFEINNDIIRLKNFYKSQGFKDVTISFNIEYFPNNKVDVNFIIDEGKKYYFSDLKINNKLDSNNTLDDNLKNFLDNYLIKNKIYNSNELDNIESKISQILENSGIQYFNITIYEKIVDLKADIMVEISKTDPIYINQINITGNTRTYDYVFRRELDIYEGDPLNNSKIKEINKKLNNLKFVGNVEIKTSKVKDNLEDVEIIVTEIQTGSFNVGLSIGTLDGASFVSGLKENNINGTGRTLEFLVNTNNDNQEFVLSTSDKFILNKNVNHGYSINYKENDFSSSKSYKLNTFALNTKFNYLFTDDTFHEIAFGYSLKDYQVTNSSSVSNNIKNSEGQSISFSLSNEIIRNTLNSYIKPTNGNYISFQNFIETPSSSSNGFIKNFITGKKYYDLNSNILSVQGKIGNIYSISNNEILSDNKFSLGGRWLRGFDNFGAGPRNSRTAYVGGNNILAVKFDYSKPITLNETNPIYFNLFNDYGSVWGNKNSVTSSDNDLRASYGFGINYYSPIGPVGFTWGFPLNDKDYDIKRMFLFSIGNLN